ncbi:GlxA family transcriptional regulator [Aliiglaciecola sp. M165]|uniref:GlxA family transcriptional regulator n=1 Tax=Aliiglaciecola sp. M165 TaxID=2593649 RepID=UPI00117CB655|nr:helix-turn-helix domain-containing protein [Aliiglaciecola sp. M165]TRY31409.1 helix-turn-helix domain-containing protein [Aliiglaciecola sp. M165]
MKVQNIAIVMIPECSASILYIVHETLQSVGKAWTFATREEVGVTPFNVEIVALTTDIINAPTGAPLKATHTFESATTPDIVIIPDLFVDPFNSVIGRWPKEARWIKSQYENGAILSSICTGALLLAESGILNGKMITTHWCALQRFEQDYPSITVKPNRVSIGTIDDRILTIGGAGGWEELIVFLVSRFRGTAESCRLSKLWLLGDKSDGIIPYATGFRKRRHDDKMIEELQLWISENYDKKNPVAEMVKITSVSKKTVYRRFMQATGYTPIEYVVSLRMEEAKDCLEANNTNIEEIASDVGYSDMSSFRRLFKKHTGVTPNQYRKKFLKYPIKP